jgi:hypothetical protein
LTNHSVARLEIGGGFEPEGGKVGRTIELRGGQCAQVRKRFVGKR